MKRRKNLRWNKRNEGISSKKGKNEKMRKETWKH
jgi:hypothetical protein